MLQILWGDGMLSPGGEKHLDEIVKELDLQDKLILDIGCAIGGFDVLLAKKLSIAAKMVFYELLPVGCKNSIQLEQNQMVGGASQLNSRFIQL